MARIRGKDTAPELYLRAGLRIAGLRCKLNAKADGIRADIVLGSLPARVAVFIDGCFWHGCPEHYVPPRSRVAFWATKLAGNVARDQRQTHVLEQAGWRVVRLWEHEVFENLDATVERVRRCLGPRRPRRSVSWRVGRGVARPRAGRRASLLDRLEGRQPGRDRRAPPADAEGAGTEVPVWIPEVMSEWPC